MYLCIDLVATYRWQTNEFIFKSKNKLASDRTDKLRLWFRSLLIGRNESVLRSVDRSIDRPISSTMKRFNFDFVLLASPIESRYLFCFFSPSSLSLSLFFTGRLAFRKWQIFPSRRTNNDKASTLLLFSNLSLIRSFLIVSANFSNRGWQSSFDRFKEFSRICIRTEKYIFKNWNYASTVFFLFFSKVENKNYTFSRIRRFLALIPRLHY